MPGISLGGLHFSVQREHPEELHHPLATFFGREKTSKAGLFLFFSFNSSLQTEIWEDPESKAIPIHPTLLPPTLLTRPLQTASVRGVFPPAEGMNRGCRAMEGKGSHRWDPASSYHFAPIYLEVQHRCHADTALAVS